MWIPASVLIDVELYYSSVPENGFTEISQEILIFLSSAIFGYLAIRRPHHRSFYLLVSAFFLCMFVRELDSFFDNVWHGFWKWPVALIVVSSISAACILKDSTWSSMAIITTSTPFAFILIGVSMLLVFSRIFGTTSFWVAVLDAHKLQSAAILVKSTVQEAIELLGYIMITYGTILHCISKTTLSPSK